jgi:Xaa-Pro dipeptidase
MTEFDDLEPMLDGVEPISPPEYEARVEKARRLMVDHGIDAIYIEAGSSLRYFLGVQWGRSERMTAAVIPARGEVAYVTPHFEVDRLCQSKQLGGDVRAWHEDQSPYERVAQILADRGIAGGTIGIEQQTRFFLYDGIRQAVPGATLISADPLTVGCRSIKSAHEIALMQRAMDITMAAYKKAVSLIREGMTPAECSANASKAFSALGVTGGISFQMGKATAFPHGSREPQRVTEGEVVLMDGGCGVEGYRSDISRTIVFGEPTQRQRDVWEVEQRAQAAAFEAAQVGVACEAVDAAARQVIVDAGFGPDYDLPGLPHRTGHGLGLDVHEPENIVRGNGTPLAPGMCFTNEPMIAIPGEFGIRLEDCIYMTDGGPRWFTPPSPSIDQPFA